MSIAEVVDPRCSSSRDPGDAWEHADDPYYPAPLTALAYHFGVSYVIYSMTQ